jgi:acyl-CoA thioester hydrolase
MLVNKNKTPIRVRYADTDQMGVAYNGVYFTWFEIGRTELMREAGLTYFEVEKYGIRLPLIEAGVKFLKPARYDDIIIVETHLEYATRIRVKFDYTVWKDADKLVTGWTEHVFTNVDLQPHKAPADLLQNLHIPWDSQANTGKREKS